MSDRITSRQAICMMILFELGSSLVAGGSMRAEQDSWIAALIGLIFAIPVVLLYAELNEFCPESDLFDMAYLAFGKVIGTIVTLLFSLFTLHTGALVMRHFTEHVHVLSLPETPQAVCAVFIGLLACYAVWGGIEAPARSAEFVAPIASAIVALLLGLTAKNMDFSNLQPMFDHDAKLLLKEGYAALAFPFAEIVMFLSVLCLVKDPNVSYRKCYLRGLLIPGIFFTMLIVTNITVLGVPVAKRLYFPVYGTVAAVNVGNFISRIEVLVSANFLLFGLMKVIVCLYVSCRGFSRLFGQQHYKIIAVIVATGITVLSQVVYKSTMEMFLFLPVFSLYAPLFEIVLPLAILVTLKIKMAIAAKHSQGNAEQNVPQQ